jgi:hypothetical protein
VVERVGRRESSGKEVLSSDARAGCMTRGLATTKLEAHIVLGDPRVPCLSCGKIILQGMRSKSAGSAESYGNAFERAGR